MSSTVTEYPFRIITDTFTEVHQGVMAEH